MKNIYPRTCRTCGVSFMGGPRAWYCPNCRKDRERERKKKYNKYGHERTLGGVDRCIRCGKEYVITGGRQKYCSECAEEAVKEIDRKQGLEWYKANADQYNSERNERRRVGLKKCLVCGKEFDCEGKPREICSEECRKIRRREWQRRADAKRREKKKETTSQ